MEGSPSSGALSVGGSSSWWYSHIHSHETKAPFFMAHGGSSVLGSPWRPAAAFCGRWSIVDDGATFPRRTGTLRALSPTSTRSTSQAMLDNVRCMFDWIDLSFVVCMFTNPLHCQTTFSLSLSMIKRMRPSLSVAYRNYMVVGLLLISLAGVVEGFPIKPWTGSSTRKPSTNNSPVVLEKSSDQRVLGALAIDSDESTSYMYGAYRSTATTVSHVWLQQVTHASMVLGQAIADDAVDVTRATVLTFSFILSGVWIRQVLKSVLGVFPAWMRFFFQPVLILYFVPLFLLRNLFQRLQSP